MSEFDQDNAEITDDKETEKKLLNNNWWLRKETRWGYKWQMMEIKQNVRSGWLNYS